MRCLSLLPLLAAVSLVACEIDDNLGGLDNESATRIRVLHASPTAPILDAVLNFSLVAEQLVYTEASGYVGVEPNEHTFEFRRSIARALIDPTPLVRTFLTVLPNQRYTILAVDSFATFRISDPKFFTPRGTSIEPLTLLDDMSPPPAGTTRLRFVDAAPSTELVDVFITAPGANLNNTVPTFRNLTFQSVATYINVPAATYQIRVTLAGTTTVILDVNTFSATAGSAFTLVMLDAPAGGPPSILRTLVDRP